MDRFKAILVFILFNQLSIIFFKLSEIEIDFFARIFLKQRSTKLDNNWFPYSKFALDISLNAVDRLPVVIVCSFLKSSLELSFVDNIDLLIVIKPENSHVFIENSSFLSLLFQLSLDPQSPGSGCFLAESSLRSRFLHTSCHNFLEKFFFIFTKKAYSVSFPGSPDLEEVFLNS